MLPVFAEDLYPCFSGGCLGRLWHSPMDKCCWTHRELWRCPTGFYTLQHKLPCKNWYQQRSNIFHSSSYFCVTNAYPSAEELNWHVWCQLSFINCCIVFYMVCVPFISKALSHKQKSKNGIRRSCNWSIYQWPLPSSMSVRSSIFPKDQVFKILIYITKSGLY